MNAISGVYFLSALQSHYLGKHTTEMNNLISVDFTRKSSFYADQVTWNLGLGSLVYRYNVLVLFYKLSHDSRGIVGRPVEHG